MGRTPEMGREEWQTVGTKTKKVQSNRGRQTTAERSYGSSGRTTKKTLQIRTSRFSILSYFSNEEENNSEIELLKKQIRELPGPSNLTGTVHVRKSEKQTKGKAGQKQDGRLEDSGPNNSPNALQDSMGHNKKGSRFGPIQPIQDK